jgi:branched-chain amino acid transport system ATP-binding protein
MSIDASPALLEVSALDAFHGEAQALHGVSFRVQAGEIVSIVGANGAGKTTLIRAIAGMHGARTGGVRFDGREIGGADSVAVCELGIAQVPEGRQIFPTLSVQENLALGASLKRARARRRENLERVYATFPRLAERRRQRAGTLSGGEQQMLAIGRALMADPKLVMLDEPSLGLSPAFTEAMFGVVAELHRAGLGIVLVEQNVAESLELCQRAYVLEAGKIVLQGTGAELLHDDRVRVAYLGV